MKYIVAEYVKNNVLQDDGQFACREATDEEGEKCDMPECPYTDWGEWSKCTGEFCGAGQVGSRTRTRDCIPAVSICENRYCVVMKTIKNISNICSK